MSNTSVHPYRKCTVHGSDMLRKTNNRTGGVFYGCCLFESHGCRVSWSDRDERYFQDPTVVARASTKRGRGTSLRARIIAALVGRGAGTKEEVEALLDKEGLMGFKELLDEE